MAWSLGKKKTQGEGVKGKKKGRGKDSTPELQDEIMGLGKKEKSVLMTHMRESVAESAIDAVKAHSELVSGSQALVVIADARALGVISGNKVVGSEASGFFREIESSSILVVTSQELLLEDKFIILPDEEGMAELAEYSFLRQAGLPAEGEDAALSWGMMELTGNAIVYTVGEPTTLAGIKEAQGEGFVHQLGAGSTSSGTGVDDTVIDEEVPVQEAERPEDVPAVSDGPTDTGSLTSVTSVEPEPAGRIEGLPEGYDPEDLMEEPNYNEMNELDSESFDPHDGSEEEEDFNPATFTEVTAVVTGDVELSQETEPEVRHVMVDEAGSLQPAVVEPESVMDDREIGTADVKRVLDRYIFNEELNLSVNLGELLQSIGVYDTPVLVETAEDGGWLDEQLAGIARNYNTELQARRQSMAIELETLLNGLFTRLHEDINKAVSLKGETSYAQTKQNLESSLNQTLGSLDGEVGQAKKKLEDAFHQARQAYAERARQAAADEYDRQHQRGHQVELERVEDALTETYQKAHDTSLQDLLKERQADAQEMWNLGSQRIMGLGLQFWRERQVDFDAVRQEAYDQLTDYIDSFRKDELARVQVLAEDQARHDAVEALKERMEAQRNAYESSLAERDAAHSMLVNEMSDSLKKAEGRQNEAVRANDKKWESIVDGLKAEHLTQTKGLQERLEARIKELTSAIEQERQSKAELRESVDVQVAERVKNYNETVESKDALIKAKTEEAAEAQRRADMAVTDAERRHRINIGMWVAIVIIACIVGFLVGDRLSAGGGTAASVDTQLVFESLSVWLI